MNPASICEMHKVSGMFFAWVRAFESHIKVPGTGFHGSNESVQNRVSAQILGV